MICIIARCKRAKYFGIDGLTIFPRNNGYRLLSRTTITRNEYVGIKLQNEKSSPEFSQSKPSDTASVPELYSKLDSKIKHAKHNAFNIPEDEIPILREFKAHESSAKFALRPYQQQCISDIISAFQQGWNRVGVSMATGGGKTVIFSHLITATVPQPGQGSKVLVLVHRRELAAQAKEKIKSVNPHLRVEVEMASQKASNDADVIIASVATLSGSKSRRLEEERYNPSSFKLIIIDEAHHSAAKSYVKVLKHFSATTPDSKVYVTGFSATLQRHDQLSLEIAMDKIVYDRDVFSMIEDGHLCDFSSTTIKATINMESVIEQERLEKIKKAELQQEKKDTQKMIEESLSEPDRLEMEMKLAQITKQLRKHVITSDFNARNLSKVLNTESVNELVFGVWKKYFDSHDLKSTIVFCVDIKHCKDLCELFRSFGINADYVVSDTKDFNRAEAVQRFKSGEIPILFNCGIFTEGTDIPNIDSIFMLRPTRSVGLFMQMLGRGLRLYEGKKICRVFDFVGNLSAHKSGMITTPEIMGLDPDTVLTNTSLKQVRSNPEQFINLVPVPPVDPEEEAKDSKKSASEKKRIQEFKAAHNESKLLEKQNVINYTLGNVEFTSFEGIVNLLSSNPNRGGKDSFGDDDTEALDFSSSLNDWIRVKPKEYILSGSDQFLRVMQDPDSGANNKWAIESVLRYPALKFLVKKKMIRDLEPETVLQVADNLADSFFQSPLSVIVIKKYGAWRDKDVSQNQREKVKKTLQKVFNLKKIKTLYETYKKLDDETKKLGGSVLDSDVVEGQHGLGKILDLHDMDQRSALISEMVQDPFAENSYTWINKLNRGQAATLLTLEKHGGLGLELEKFLRKLVRLKKVSIEEQRWIIEKAKKVQQKKMELQIN